VSIPFRTKNCKHLWASCLLALVGLCLATLLHADSLEKRPLGQAMDDVRKNNWESAYRHAAKDGANAMAVIDWHLLRAGRGTAQQVFDFLDMYSDWPGLPYLRQRSEGTVATAPADQLLAFFAEQLPRTGTGALAHARALRETEDPKAADDAVIRAWTTLKMSTNERREFLTQYDALLQPHHKTRLEEALWRGWSADARGLLSLVDAQTRALAEVRLRLRNDETRVDRAIDALSTEAQNSPGLAYERFEWRMRNGRWRDAAKLLDERSAKPQDLGRPKPWARHRRTLARNAMRDGETDLAYRLAARHSLSTGTDYAALEWLAGFIALRQKNDPNLAIEHFNRFLADVDTPISLARAGYWLGRAYEAARQQDQARVAYTTAAKYQTAYYGLLAAERANLPLDPDLSGAQDFLPWTTAPFLSSSVFDAAILLLAGGEISLAERYFTHLAESLDKDQIRQMARLLEELGQPHIQVMLGKRAARYGMEIAGPYYALHPLADRPHPVPPEMMLAIARRESEFDPLVVSPVGARGMMQLMPGTAREMAQKERLQYDQRKLLSDVDYNIRLGGAYLAELASLFGGNPVLVAAAYNAGPSRPERWMRLYGDPRDVDVVDWVEFIPFEETRNYVMRVTESLPVYRARLGLNPLPRPFTQELTGSGLLAGAP
jgi:soluble lytic murein transglycosylase